MINTEYELPYKAVAIFSLSWAVLSGLALYFIGISSQEGCCLLGSCCLSTLIFCLTNAFLYQQRKKAILSTSITHQQKLTIPSLIAPNQQTISTPPLSSVPKAQEARVTLLPLSTIIIPRVDCQSHISSMSQVTSSTVTPAPLSSSASILSTSSSSASTSASPPDLPSSASILSTSSSSVSTSASPPDLPSSASILSTSSSSVSTSVSPPDILASPQSIVQTNTVTRKLEVFAFSIYDFMITVLKLHQKKDLSGKSRDIIRKACMKIPSKLCIFDETNLRSSLDRNEISFSMPLFSLKDITFLKELATTNNHLEMLEQLKRLEEVYRETVNKVNMCGKMLLYYRNLFRIGYALKEAGHTAHLKEFAAFEALKSELDLIISEIPRLSSYQLYSRLESFANKLPFTLILHETWKFDDETIQRLSEQSVSVAKIPRRLMKLNIKNINEELGTISKDKLNSGLRRELLAYVPKISIRMPPKDALLLISESVLPFFHHVLNSNSFYDPVANFYKMIMMIQALSVIPREQATKMTFPLQKSGLADPDFLSYLSKINMASKLPFSWNVIDYYTRNEIIQSRLSILPSIIKIMFEPFYHLKRPGKFRKKILPIVSTISTLQSDLRLEASKDRLDINSVLDCFIKHFDSMRTQIEKAK